VIPRSNNDLTELLREDADDVCSPAELLARTAQAPRSTSTPRWPLVLGTALVVAAVAIGATLFATEKHPSPSRPGPHRSVGHPATGYQGPITQRKTFGPSHEIIAEPPGNRKPKVTYRQVLQRCGGCADHGYTATFLASVSTPSVGRTRHGRGRVVKPVYDHTLAYVVVSRDKPCGPPLGGPAPAPGEPVRTTQPTFTPSNTCFSVFVYSADTGKVGYGVSD
jgi:hypothetical protein